MPARPWPLATTLAAVALTTTSCVAGPTITDEQKPAAATAPTSAVPITPNVPPGPGALPSGASGAASQPPSPSESQRPILRIGGEPARFRDGTQVGVQRVVAEGDGGASTAPRVLVELKIRNGTDKDLKPFFLTVELNACGTAPCRPGGRVVGDSTAIRPGDEALSPRYFVPPSNGLPDNVQGVIEYKSERVSFEGKPS